jgi:hypothetical protein
VHRQGLNFRERKPCLPNVRWTRPLPPQRRQIGLGEFLIGSKNFLISGSDIPRLRNSSSDAISPVRVSILANFCEAVNARTVQRDNAGLETGVSADGLSQTENRFEHDLGDLF